MRPKRKLNYREKDEGDFKEEESKFKLKAFRRKTKEAKSEDEEPKFDLQVLSQMDDSSSKHFIVEKQEDINGIIRTKCLECNVWIGNIYTHKNTLHHPQNTVQCDECHFYLRTKEGLHMHKIIWHKKYIPPIFDPNSRPNIWKEGKGVGLVHTSFELHNSEAYLLESVLLQVLQSVENNTLTNKFIQYSRDVAEILNPDEVFTLGT